MNTASFAHAPPDLGEARGSAEQGETSVAVYEDDGFHAEFDPSATLPLLLIRMHPFVGRDLSGFGQLDHVHRRRRAASPA